MLFPVVFPLVVTTSRFSVTSEIFFSSLSREPISSAPGKARVSNMNLNISQLMFIFLSFKMNDPPTGDGLIHLLRCEMDLNHGTFTNNYANSLPVDPHFPGEECQFPVPLLKLLSMLWFFLL